MVPAVFAPTYCGVNLSLNTHAFCFYVVFLVKHIFYQVVDVSEHIDFTPTSMYPAKEIADCRANMKATFFKFLKNVLY